MKISKTQAKRLWIHAQKLDTPNPFGAGPTATQKAVEHLGYVQIDTINVIERCHHHILYNRIPRYKRQDLQQAQSKDKSVFEFWTHALSYVPTRDFRFYMSDMKRTQTSPSKWFQSVKKEELQKVLRLIKKEGAISIRDIKDDVLVEKEHAWASMKPSKKALQWGFYSGRLTVSERVGMLKKYELLDRHFDWDEKPKPASEKEVLNYLLERSLRAQGLVSIDSICHLDNKSKPGVKKLIETQVKRGELLPIEIEGVEKFQFWARPEDLDLKLKPEHDLVHILSPFDPLVILRKRLHAFFEYNHLFEAYIPKEKRVFGYFSLPVLSEDKIVAVLDLKTDRQEQKMRIQKWTWLEKHKSAANKKKIETELHRFEKFQLDSK